MSSKTRLANKTQWGLDDILEACPRATRWWQMAMDRAERKMDPTMMLALAKLRDEMAYIERKARDTRDGKYDQEKVIE